MAPILSYPHSVPRPGREAAAEPRRGRRRQVREPRAAEGAGPGGGRRQRGRREALPLVQADGGLVDNLLMGWWDHLEKGTLSEAADMETIHNLKE